MDYLRPIEALIPGARGRVLTALVNNASPQTIRQVALSAGVSTSRAGQLLEDLAELGIVERRRLASSHVLVRLMPENVTAAFILEVAGIWTPALEEMRQGAAMITPAPLTLTVFGSFARREAQRGSDVDVFAVHGHSAESETEEGLRTEDLWVATTGAWVDSAQRITGNPVNLIDLDLEEAQELASTVSLPGWMSAAAREGVVLAGVPIRELVQFPAARLVGARGR